MDTVARTSFLARSSLQAGLLAFFFALVGLMLALPLFVMIAILFGLPAFLLGIAGGFDVWLSKSPKHGIGLALGGIVTTVLAGFLGMITGAG